MSPSSWSMRATTLLCSGMTYSVRMRAERAFVVAVQVDEAWKARPLPLVNNQ